MLFDRFHVVNSLPYVRCLQAVCRFVVNWEGGGERGGEDREKSCWREINKLVPIVGLTD